MKKIIELCLSPDLGGLEIFAAKCYYAFKKKGFCSFVLAPKKKLDYLLEEERVYIKRNKFFPFIPAWKLAKYIDKNEIDLLHFHWNRDILTAVLAKILSKRKPKLIQTRNMGMTRYKKDIYHRWLYRNIDMIHAVTKEVKRQLIHYIPKDVRPKIEVVYMGCKIPPQKGDLSNLKQKYGLKDEFIVGIVGRIEEAKGQWLLIEAMEKLKSYNIKALIVGHTMDEIYLKNLQNRVKELGLDDRVVFTGFTKEVDSHFQLMDAAILATENETFGLVVIEAMANGVAVIATNRGGPLEIIEDKHDGLLFNREVSDLVQKIKLLYEDRELLKKIANNGKKKVEKKFNEEIQLEKLYGVIDAL